MIKQVKNGRPEMSQLFSRYSLFLVLKLSDPAALVTLYGLVPLSSSICVEGILMSDTGTE